ncbi:MAG: hypothetical protein LBI42_06940 [Chitinispirillales bacterium]|jgi:hypothetical protein|nr:hypothetical protein [Chitinispirillales bacterium]
MRKKQRVLLSFLFIGILLVTGGSLLIIKNISRITTFNKNDWAIGIYTGTSPFTLAPADGIVNPVLTANNVTDIKAEFVADPFMIKKDSCWYMFFEALNALTNKGVISLAESRDGFSWDYCSVVLQEPFHLSYPLVFLNNGEYYMIPESAESNQLRLYKSVNFPYEWKFVNTLLDGDFGDHVVFEENETWWIIVNGSSRKHDITRLFFADSLNGPYSEHPASPIVRDDASRARPGGRIPVINGMRYWLAQDCKTSYGKRLNAFEIVTLNKEEYVERAYSDKPVLVPGKFRWVRRGMHHIDAHQLEDGSWIASVDGYRRNLYISIEY